MASYTPPKKGTDPTPQTGAPVIGGRRGGVDAASPGAEEVLNRNSATTDAWITAQRNAFANSVTDIHIARLDHPEVQASYQNLYGAETITLSPKLSPPVDTPPEEPELLPPNALVELAQTEVVTPQTSLYLMVLFGTDEIAAFDMEALDAPAPVYVGKCQNTAWVATSGAILRTFQSNLAGTEYLLIPIDLTGQKANATFVLSTNALGDGIETQADPALVPMLNTDGSTIWTMSGSYVVKDGKFQLDTLPPTDGTSPMVPAAIASDGTCYYPGGLMGLVQVSYSVASFPTVTASPTIVRLVTDAQALAQKSAPSVEVSTAEMATLQTETDDSEFVSSANGTETISITVETTVVYSSAKTYADVSGYGYGCSGAYGAMPTLTGYVEARYTQDFESYLPASNTVGIVTVHGTTVIPVTLPVPGFTLGDTLPVNLIDISATQEATSTLTPVAGAAARNAANVVSWAGGTIRTAGGNTISGIVTTWFVDGYDPTGAVSRAEITSAGDAQSRYQGLISAMLAAGTDSGAIPETVVPLSVKLTYTQTDITGSASGQYDASTIPAGLDPADLVSTGYAIGHANGTIENVTVASDLRIPQAVPFDPTDTSTCYVSLFGEALSYNSATPLAGSYALVHTMPPMLNSLPFYTRVDQIGAGNKATVVTPYGRFDGGAAAEAFTPWLHLSNGKHIIQGFKINGAPMAFLDGGTAPFLAAMALSLQCDVTDIVAMVMDVTMAKIKAVAHVTGQGYTG